MHETIDNAWVRGGRGGRGLEHSNRVEFEDQDIALEKTRGRKVMRAKW